MRLIRSQAGSSLVEVLVGGLIALLALGAIIQIQITGYRNNKSDEDHFVLQSEALIALEQITKDIRMSSGTQEFTAGSNAVTLNMGGTRTIAYTYRGNTREVVRTEAGGAPKVIGTQVERIAFYPEQNGRTLRVEWLARTPRGLTYEMISRASPRLQTGGSN